MKVYLSGLFLTMIRDTLNEKEGKVDFNSSRSYLKQTSTHYWTLVSAKIRKAFFTGWADHVRQWKVVFDLYSCLVFTKYPTELFYT